MSKEKIGKGLYLLKCQIKPSKGMILKVEFERNMDSGEGKFYTESNQMYGEIKWLHKQEYEFEILDVDEFNNISKFKYKILSYIDKWEVNLSGRKFTLPWPTEPIGKTSIIDVNKGDLDNHFDYIPVSSFHSHLPEYPVKIGHRWTINEPSIIKLAGEVAQPWEFEGHCNLLFVTIHSTKDDQIAKIDYELQITASDVNGSSSKKIGRGSIYNSLNKVSTKIVFNGNEKRNFTWVTNSKKIDVTLSGFYKFKFNFEEVS